MGRYAIPLWKSVSFQYIAKKPLFGIAIAKTSVNGTIDNMQYPLFLGIAIANAIAQCERTLRNHFLA